MPGTYCFLLCLNMDIFYDHKYVQSAKIRYVRRSWGRSNLNVIMLIWSILNMQNADEKFSAEGSEMASHLHSARNLWKQ